MGHVQIKKIKNKKIKKSQSYHRAIEDPENRGHEVSSLRSEATNRFRAETLSPTKEDKKVRPFMMNK